MSDSGDMKLPVPRSGTGPAPSLFAPQPRHTGGIVDTWVTRWQAKRKAAAHTELAALNRAKADEIRAYGEMVNEYRNTAKTVATLDDLQDEIALERAERAAERCAKYAKLDHDRDERQHQAEKTKFRRERELHDAQRAVIEAKRGVFNAEQGLENQQRLKQLNMEIWEKRAATEHMDAEKVRVLLEREVEGIKSPQADEREGALDRLAEMRASLALRAQELSASGDASQAEKYERLAADLDELVVDALPQPLAELSPD